jgi:hypothetical protein
VNWRVTAIVLGVLVLAVVMLGAVGLIHRHDTAACVNHQLRVESPLFTTAGIQGALRAYPSPYDGPGVGPSTTGISYARGLCGESR